MNIPGEVNGTANQRITLGAYPGERVVLQGLGTEQFWDDRTTNFGSSEGFNQVGILVSGDYWTIQGLRIEWFGEAFMSVEGDHVQIFDNDMQYTFRFGLEIGAGDAVSDNGDTVAPEVSWNRVRNVYHHSGIYLLPPKEGVLVDPVVMYNLVYQSGIEADGDQVPEGPNGDSAGGGNSDGITIENQCSNTGTQRCFDGKIAYNILIENADDCIDNAGRGFEFVGNIMMGCGPQGNRGIKFWSAESGNQVVSNFAHHSGSDGNSLPGMSFGYELRAADQIPSINNASLYSTNKGFNGFGTIGRSENNLSYGSSSREFFDYNVGSTDWDGDNRGDPQLGACGSDLTIDLRPLSDDDLDAKSRLVHLYRQFVDLCGPAEGSPLVDAGSVVDGVHCPQSDDDNPAGASDPNCLHWKGTAPDIGPFERGLWD